MENGHDARPTSLALSTTSGTSDSTASPSSPWPSSRPPNRHLYDRQMEELHSIIQSKDGRRRFLQDQLKSMRDQLSGCRSEKEAIHEERTAVENELITINKNVDQKREEVQRLRASLPYLSEEPILEQVKKLEYQLRKYSFKPAEEKKIVGEIDKLNRSKRHLQEHNVLKTDLDRLRSTQRGMRERRDLLFRQRGDAKRREDGLKRGTKDISDELDVLRADLDDLNAQKRQSVADFKAHEADYRKYLLQRREEKKQRWREEREAVAAEKQREIDEIRAHSEPYEQELNLVTNLIGYCLRFELSSAASMSPCQAPNRSFSTYNGLLSVPGLEDFRRRGSHESGLRRGSSSTFASSESSSVYVTPISSPMVDVKEGGFAYRKDDNWDEHACKKSSRKNSRNERRNSKARPLNHNPEVFAQFDSFGLTPPASSKDIERVIEALRNKQQYFESLASEHKSRCHSDPAPLPSTADSVPTPSAMSSRLSVPSLCVDTCGDVNEAVQEESETDATPDKEEPEPGVVDVASEPVAENGSHEVVNIAQKKERELNTSELIFSLSDKMKLSDANLSVQDL